MFGQKDNSAREIYTSFYTPKTGADGVWELPLVLETVAEASETTIPLPLPYRKLNAEVLEYLEDVAQQMPKGEEARIVVYLPIEEIQQGLEQKLNKVLDIYQQGAGHLWRRSAGETQARRETGFGRVAERLGVGLCVHARLPDHRRPCGFSETSDAHQHDFGRFSGPGLGCALEAVRNLAVRLETVGGAHETP